MRKKRKNSKKINIKNDSFEDNIIGEDFYLQNDKIKNKTTKNKKNNENNKVKKIKSLKLSASHDRKTIEVKITNKKIKKFNLNEKNKVEKIKKGKIPKANKHDLEENFDYYGNYFYQKITEKEWVEIDEFFRNYFRNKNSNLKVIKLFLEKFPNLKKGEDNINKFKKVYLVIYFNIQFLRLLFIIFL